MLNASIIAFIALILGFGFLIFVHELGHFLVAKWVGIRCQQFAIGFGPAALAWRKGIGLRGQSTDEAYQQRIREALKTEGKDPEKASEQQLFAAADNHGLGETEYRLNYIPLGGYVKMLGQEDLDPAAQSQDPRAYNQKPIWARLCVLSAGVVMNVIFGLLFFIVAFMIGVNFPTTQVGGVAPNTPAATTYAQGHSGEPAYRGLQVGDRITHIDGEKITDFMAMKMSIALSSENESLTLGVRRHGRRLNYAMTPQTSENADMPTIGVQPMSAMTVAGLRPYANDLEQAGLRGGMQLVSVAGKPVESYTDYYRRLIEARGEPVPVTFEGTVNNEEGGEQTRRVTVQLAAQPELTRARYANHQQQTAANLIGFVPPTGIKAFGENSASAIKKAGAQAGDLFALLAGQPWPTPEQVRNLTEAAGSDPIHAVLWREGQLQSLGQVKPIAGKLGMWPLSYHQQPIVGQTLPGSPAAALDLPGGSRLLAVNGKAVDSWTALQRTLAEIVSRASSRASESPTSFQIRYRLSVADQPEGTGTVQLTPAQMQQLAAATWAMPQSLVFDPRREPVVAANPWEAAVMGVTKTRDFIINTYLTLVRLIQGTISPDAVSGPIGIVHVGTSAAQRGFSWLLFFLGLISVNLAVINFLPIPVLDGGHVLFLLIEKIKGAPPSAAVQNAAMFAGLALLGCVMLLVTYNDIARIVGGG